MTKVIQTTDTDGTGPRIVTVPGVSGYSARYVAAHLDREAGSVVTSWPATSAGAALALVGGASKFTIGDDGDYYLSTPGGTNAGGRLLGAHTMQRPFTIAAVVKADAGFLFMGMTGLEAGRNAAGDWYQRSTTGAVATSSVSDSGWVLILMNAHTDGTHSLTVGNVTTGRAALGVATPSYGGLYFGASAAGQNANVREIVVWHSDLNASARASVSKYFRERYASLGR